MKEYHKIQTVYLRDPENNHKTLLNKERNVIDRGSVILSLVHPVHFLYP